MTKKLRLGGRLIIPFILVSTLLGTIRIYAQPENPEPSFINELESKEMVLVGRIAEGQGSFMYNGANTNGFTIVSGCHNYGGVAVSLKKLKPRLLSLVGTQVAVSGQMNKIDMTQLLKENPTSECALNLSASRLNYFFLEAKKIEPTVFYELTPPIGKVDWDKPLNIGLEVKNPLKESIDNLQLSVYSDNNVYYPFDRPVDLAPGENKSITAVLQPRKPDLAREEGTTIKLVIQGYSKKNKLDYLVLFEEAIAYYDPEGLLEER